MSAERLLTLLRNTAPVMGAIGKEGKYRATQLTDLSELKVSRKVNVYHSVQRMRPGLPPGSRGGAADVEEVLAVYLDIDFKDSGAGDEKTARAIIADMSDLLGTPPAAVVHSGGGLQPYWPVSDGADVHKAIRALRRFGLLADAVAEVHGATLDTVYDLPRVLRTPGSLNHKYDPPREVTCDFAATWTPLTVAGIHDLCDTYGIPEAREMDEGVVISSPSDWELADRTCAYVTSMIKAWQTDTAKKGRHQWHLDRAVRLACAVRLGCITEVDFEKACDLLTARVKQWRDKGEHGPKAPTPKHESVAVLRWGIQRASRKSKADARKELGDHSHSAAGTRFRSAFAKTDHITMAEAFLHRHSAHLRYVTDAKTFSAYADGVWSDPGDTEGEGLVGHLATAFIAEVAEDAALRVFRALAEEKGEEVASEEAKKVETAMRNAGYVSNVLKQAERQALLFPGMAVTVDDFDKAAHMLVTPTEVVDLRDGSVHSHDPGLLATRRTRVSYRPDAACPQFLAFLEDVQPEQPMRDYLQRREGAGAVGRQNEHVFHIDLGTEGRNGKGVFHAATGHALGTYATVAPSEILMTSRNDRHREEIARLQGRRKVMIDEAKDSRKFDAATVKTLTGGAARAARYMRGNTFTYEPTDTIVLLTNEVPKFQGEDDAFAARLHVVPWVVTVRGREDLSLGTRLQDEDEAEGILAWIVAGALEYHRQGLAAPAGVVMQTEATVAEHNLVEQWVLDAVQEGGDMAAEDALKAFRQWVRDNHPADRDHLDINRNKFGRELRKALKKVFGLGGGSKPKKVGGKVVKVYEGASLRGGVALWGGGL